MNAKPPSERALLAQRLATFLIENDLCQVYGGDVSLVKVPRPHYTVAFSKRATLDASISVYSPTFIVVEWMTQNRTMPHEGKRLFASEALARDFVRLAFVEHNTEAAMAVAHK